MTKEEMEAMLSGRINALRTSAMNGTKNTVTNQAMGVSATPAATSAASTAATGTDTLSKAYIDQLTGADRIWAGLEAGYNQQRDALKKQTNQNASSVDRQMLSRGMQRSSFGQQLRANELQHGSDELAKSYQQQASEYASLLTNQENQDKQYQLQLDQFEWQKKTADQELAATWVGQILAAGGTPSADLLARAGISDADYAAMKPAVAEASGGGSGGGSGQRKTTGGETVTASDANLNKLLAGLGSGGNSSGSSPTLAAITKAYKSSGEKGLDSLKKSVNTVLKK